MTDTLYLLDPAFTDAAYPDRVFFCPDCITVDGLLNAFPECAADLTIIRIPYPRPRDAVIAVVGAAHQNLPLLVLGEGTATDGADGEVNGTFFVRDFKQLLYALHSRHGFPEAHP